VGDFDWGGGPGDGAAHLFYGDPYGPQQWEVPLGWPGASGNFGAALSTAGDVNNDGYSDFVVGEPAYDHFSNEGRIHLYLGERDGLSAPEPWWTYTHDVPNMMMGSALGGGGDVTGDGFGDVLVGAPFDQSVVVLVPGRAVLFQGNHGAGRLRAPQQFQTDGVTPIATLGRAAGSSFEIHAQGRTPMGRGRVRLECEVKPLGMLFNGVGTIIGDEVDTEEPIDPTLGSCVQVSQLVSGPGGETVHHWRFRTLSDCPFVPRSPWISLPSNASTETDLRTEPGGAAIAEEGAPDQQRARSLMLSASGPLPFAAATRLDYSVPEAGPVRLAIYDALGRHAATLVDGRIDRGDYAVTWNGTDATGRRLASGVYFARLQSRTEVRVVRLVITR
jgi:hypothetical protein